jgi:purine-cytosine permease-like protein
MVNSIVGGQVITELSNGKVPLVVGVILIAIISLIVALLGYKFVHYFERFSWMIMITLFCIVAGLGAKHFYNAPWQSGSVEAAGVLSFGGAVFGFAVAWISLTADYNVNMREEIPRWKVFFWTYLGLFMSLNLIEWLGIFCAQTAVDEKVPLVWQQPLLTKIGQLHIKMAQLVGLLVPYSPQLEDSANSVLCSWHSQL